MSKNKIIAAGILVILASCGGNNNGTEIAEAPEEGIVSLEAESFVSSDGDVTKNEESVTLAGQGWLAYDMQVEESGRYAVRAISADNSTGVVWIEDYRDNPDGRTYDITGKIDLTESIKGVDGSPLGAGLHPVRIHWDGNLTLDKVNFKLLRPLRQTPKIMTQNMGGNNLKLKWADEFEGNIIDTTKWLYDIGDWGWGNNELQYYTLNDPENARVEDGKLVIEARKDENGNWTSARLTTRERVSFLYGKIELKAKVPRDKGNWAAGWTLGDDYIDERSWPYSGEIDILESVGYEVNDETGDGIAHATVHTPAYYFKINNQISSTREVKGIANDFHTYSVIWTPSEIRGLVDGEEYYLYDKNANEKEWPFSKPQNIILNLAMGGGWGGAQGMDTTVTSQKFILDYVRVYEMTK